jgi:hypothetical protein
MTDDDDDRPPPHPDDGAPVEMQKAELYLLRLSQTRWLIGWLRGDELKACRDELAFVRAMIPRFNTPTAIRMAVLQHVGTIPLPAGSRMEFVVRALEASLALVDWGQVDEALKEPTP